jgi:hypothetical protein
MSFTKATKKQAKLRMAIDGPSGSGKTFTSLMLAKKLCPNGKRIRVLDSERGSASKYADVFDFDTAAIDPPFTLDKYIALIREAAADPETGVLIIDSLSHAWSGEGGALDRVEQEKTKTRNDFTAWRNVTPLHNKLVDTILSCPVHVLVTMRTKIEYVMEQNDKGKMVPKKVGTKPVQREGMEYEFDVIVDMDVENNGIVSKSRCSALSGNVYRKPGDDVGGILLNWLSDGEPATPATETEAKLMFQKAGIPVNQEDPLNEIKVGLLDLISSSNKDEFGALPANIKNSGLANDADIRAAYSTRKKELGL